MRINPQQLFLVKAGCVFFMARGRFWKNVANIFIIILKFFWFCTIFTFVILPRLIILPARRGYVKIRIQRKLVKNGLPRKNAKIIARKYRSMLYDYGSIIGLSKMTGNIKGKKDDEKEENEITEHQKNTGKKFNSLTFMT